MVENSDAFNQLLNFIIEITGASIAIVGLLLVVTYEFQHANEFSASLKWLRITHNGIGSTLSLLIGSILGTISKFSFISKERKKILIFGMAVSISVGIFLLLTVLVILFIETK